MAHVLPALPYAKDALEPVISEETLDFHYGKHHQAYVTNLNNLVPGTAFENASLEEIVMKSPWYLLVLVLWNVYVGIILYPYLAFH